MRSPYPRDSVSLRRLLTTTDSEGPGGDVGPLLPLVVRGQEGKVSTVEYLDGVPDGYRVSIQQDDDPENPRNNSYGPVHVLTVPDRDYVDVDKDPGPWGPQWRHLLDRYDWSKAIEIIERYAALIGGFTYDHAPVRGARSVWYLTREDAAEYEYWDPRTALEAYACEYQAWCDGDVYGYMIEKRQTWQRVDDPTVISTRWEIIDACWGFYGREYIESEAREALEAHL